MQRNTHQGSWSPEGLPQTVPLTHKNISTTSASGRSETGKLVERTSQTFVLRDEVSHFSDLRQIPKNTRGLQNSIHTGAQQEL